jgi:uncharacterized membrane protein YsdA (DUF1294 family)
VHTVLSFAIGLRAIGRLTVFSFAADPRAAMRGERRIRESTLLWLAAPGGSPAACPAQRRYRHKTRQQEFSFRLYLVATTQAGIAPGLAPLLA